MSRFDFMRKKKHGSDHLRYGSDPFLHFHNIDSVALYNADEVVVSSTTWTLVDWQNLIAMVKNNPWVFDLYGAEILLSDPLPTRGGDARFTHQLSGESEYEILTCRLEGTDWWDFKNFFVSYFYPSGAKGKNLLARVYFKVDNISYPLTVRKRSLLTWEDAVQKYPEAP